MLFNSFQFIVFLPIVFIAFYALPHRFRWALLLTASYYFYMSWKPEYIFLILGCTIVAFLAGIGIEKAKDKKQKKIFLISSLSLIFSSLFVFKYFNFAVDNLSYIFSKIGVSNMVSYWDLLLPVGISFFTFQAGSYVIDVYMGNKKAERHFGMFALFVSFFPQLVAGPIERSKHLLPQLKSKKRFQYKYIPKAVWLMALGFFKKVVVADRLGLIVSEIYTDPSSYSPAMLIIGTLFFSFQIYCDFSGYSDIAIGSAKLFGIDLMENFRRPYFSASVGEFWRRWHISLSTWLKDYIYVPLGGNRKGKLNTVKNILVTFLASGVWHGAAWTFVLWGGIHGFFVATERGVLNKFKIPKPILIFITFSIVTLAWIPFRANSISDAIYIFLAIAGYSISVAQSNLMILFMLLFVAVLYALRRAIKQPFLKKLKNNQVGMKLFIFSTAIAPFFFVEQIKNIELPGVSKYQAIVALFSIYLLLIVDGFIEYYNSQSSRDTIIKTKIYMRYGYLIKLFFLSLVVTCILLFGMFTKAQFIYFQF